MEADGAGFRPYHTRGYKLPVSGWTLRGYSRAMERSGFWLVEPGIVLDAGLDLPFQCASPAAVLVTHGHIDHMNALPMLARHAPTPGQGPQRPLQILAPRPIVHRLRAMVQLSFAAKVDFQEPVPREYAEPPVGEALAPAGSALCATGRELVVWRPVEEGTVLELQGGRKGALALSVRAVRLVHRCTTLGYVVSSAAHTARVLRPDLRGASKEETAALAKAARARGEDTLVDEARPERPLVAYLTDTTAAALAIPQTAAAVDECPVLVIECTYLDRSLEEEALRRGHICWHQLLPHVLARARAGPPATWVLIHLSLRHSSQDARAFFADPARCGAAFAGKGAREEDGKAGAEGSEAGPGTAPDLVLWLDNGPWELWLTGAGAADGAGARAAGAEDGGAGVASTGPQAGAAAVCSPCCDNGS